MDPNAAAMARGGRVTTTKWGEADDVKFVSPVAAVVCDEHGEKKLKQLTLTESRKHPFLQSTAP